jgi:hypothetical protein
MSAFDSLLKNPMIKTVFMKQFKNIVKEHNLKAIVIEPGEDGELEPQLYTEPIKVMKLSEYNQLMESLKSIL